MAIDYGNGFVVSGPAFGEKTQTDADRRQEVLRKYGGVQGVANSGISFDKLLEELSGLRWDIPLFDTITAGQAIGAYQNGTLPTPQQGKEAIQSGAYNGTYQDYMNENIAKATGVEYMKGSGNQTLDDLNNAVGAAPSDSSSGTDYLDQLTAIQNSGNAPSANMQGWADSFIGKLGKAQSGGDSKEEAFNKMWANYAEGNPDHASPELQAVLRQMAGLDGGDSGTSGNTGSGYVSMPSNSVETSLWKAPFTGGTAEKLPGTLTTPSYTLLGSEGSSFGTSGGGSSSPGTLTGTGGTFPGTFPNTSGSSVGDGTSGGSNDAFAQYLAKVTDSGYNKQMSGSISDLENLYKDLFGNIRDGDYTKKPYYQTILESYGLAGDAAADDAVAASVGSNGGNLDSYAAANAKRQQLAYKNAAQGAALDAYNAEIGNLIKTLGDLGVNVNDLYATWAQNLDSERGTAADVLLGQLGIDRDKYVTDAQAAVDKYLGELGLEGTKVQAEADKYLGQLGADTDRYLGELNTNLGMSQIEADKQMNADTLAAQREIAQMESSIKLKIAEVERLMAQDSNASAEAIQAGINEVNRLIALYQTEAEKYGVDRNAELQMTLQSWANEMAKLGYDTEYAIAALGAQSGKNSAEEATDAQKRKALEIHRTSGDAAFEEYVASFPESVQQSIRAYDAQYYVDESTVIPDAEAEGIAMNIANAVKQGEDPNKVLDYWLTKYFAQHPEHNTSQSRTKIFELVESILQ